jgi:hypothetical protein
MNNFLSHIDTLVNGNLARTSILTDGSDPRWYHRYKTLLQELAMKTMRLLVRELDQDWTGLVTYGQSERAIAGLNADPETLSELDLAMGSFAKRTHREQLFLPELEPGNDATPGDEGLVIIDLAARLLVVDREEDVFDYRAGVGFFDGEQETEQTMNFTLAGDWLITCDVANWRALASQRREERAGRTELDVRATLYGRPLLEFVAREIFAAYPRRDETPVPAPRWADETAESCVSVRDGDLIRKIHAAWLLTPRAELAGQTPRHLLYATRKQVERNMDDREHNWSYVGHPPTPVPLDSRAFKFAGIGLHEAITYYYAVRDLLWSCWQRMEELTASSGAAQPYLAVGDFLTDEVPRLESELERILKEPNEEFEGRTLWSYMESERRRMPEGGSYRDHMIDPDCPCCQMLADMPGVGFWHLDGCNMDDEFAFDLYHETQEEWDEEQRDYAEFNRRFNERQEEKKRLEVGETWQKPAEDSVWNRSLVVEDENLPVGVRIFGIGCQLAELIVDIRDGVPRELVGEESQTLIDRLNRGFGNLRELLDSADVGLSAALLEPVIQSFAASLETTGQERPKLQEKCASLARQVSKILAPPPDPTQYDGRYEFGDDIPF